MLISTKRMWGNRPQAAKLSAEMERELQYQAHEADRRLEAVRSATRLEFEQQAEHMEAQLVEQLDHMRSQLQIVETNAKQRELLAEAMVTSLRISLQEMEESSARSNSVSAPRFSKTCCLCLSSYFNMLSLPTKELSAVSLSVCRPNFLAILYLTACLLV